MSTSGITLGYSPCNPLILTVIHRYFLIFPLFLPVLTVLNPHVNPYVTGATCQKGVKTDGKGVKREQK